MNCFATDTDCLHIKNVGTHHVRKRHTISTILVNGSCSFLFKLLHQNPFSHERIRVIDRWCLAFLHGFQ